MAYWLRMPRVRRAAILVCMLAFSGAEANAKEAERLVLASGPVTGGYYLIGGAVCAQINADVAGHNLRCSVEPSAGSVANLESVRAKNVDLALVQSDWQHHGFEGSATRFAGEKSVANLRVLASLSGSPFVLLAREDGPIGKLADLRGKRVDIGKPGSARRVAMDDLLEVLDWDLGAFELASEFNVTDAVDALCAGQIAAVPLVGLGPNRQVRTALSKCKLKLVPVAGAAVKNLISEKPYYSVVQVRGGSYRGVREDVPTFGLRIVLASVFTIADTDAYNMAKAIVENLPALAKVHPTLQGLTREDLPKAGISAPLHDGAERYYREAGLM